MNKEIVDVWTRQLSPYKMDVKELRRPTMWLFSFYRNNEKMVTIKVATAVTSDNSSYFVMSTTSYWTSRKTDTINYLRIKL
jgi:hypothetical protein